MAYVREPAMGRLREVPAGRFLRPRLAVKRLFDVVVSAVVLVVFSPVILCVAIAVATRMGLPILFRQERPGLGGRLFTIYKFRTMRVTRPGEVYYLTDNERITGLGRFLRSTSLDELPELWNVLRGDMSLVGPRPLLPEYLEKYTPEESRRHLVRPGITGWAVVNGRNALMFKDRIALDVWYVDHWSLRLDLRILATTFWQVVRRQNASETEDLALGFPLPGVEPTSAELGESVAAVGVDGRSSNSEQRQDVGL